MSIDTTTTVDWDGTEGDREQGRMLVLPPESAKTESHGTRII
jgi:hypothetical protein